MNVLDALDRLDGTLHIWNGRVSGHLHERHSGASVRFRAGEDEPIDAALERAITSLRRRMREGMPITVWRGTCAACQGQNRLLRRLKGQALCDDCRRGIRELDAARREEEHRRDLLDEGPAL